MFFIIRNLYSGRKTNVLLVEHIFEHFRLLRPRFTMLLHIVSYLLGSLFLNTFLSYSISNWDFTSSTICGLIQSHIHVWEASLRIISIVSALRNFILDLLHAIVNGRSCG